ncbi:MAG: LCP family protein [Anaerolineae bacterium]|nr:LCP family protein [Anaerolineae bacterium]
MKNCKRLISPFGSARAIVLLLMLSVALVLITACTDASADSAATPRSIARSGVTDDPTATPTELPATAVPTVADTIAAPTPTPVSLPTVDSETSSASPTATQPVEPDTTPTVTPIPSPTPTSVPQERHILPEFVESETALTPVPPFQVPANTTNILLIGKDSADYGDGGGNTDTLIIVSVNNESKTASMMSIPRDLYVQIPGGKMQRINTAAYSSIGRLKDTILYNLGIEIHYYALIDFYGFQDIIDTLGGITVINSCPLTDWRIKSPELDIEDEDNWEQFTLDAGVNVMDGDLALWYARSRKSTSDFDRGRRQQQILRAILDQGIDAGLIREVPKLYGIYRETVETDLDIGRILQLATMAPGIRENGIQSIYLAGDNVIPFRTEEGYAVQLVNWDVMQNTLQRLYLPPALSRVNRVPITVEIINASGDPVLPILTAENLRWHGFTPIISPVELSPVTETRMVYFAPNLKGSYDWLISWIMDMHESEIELDAETIGETNYRIILGTDYDPCRPEIFAPQPYITANE